MVDTERFLKDRVQTALAQPSATLGSVRSVFGIRVTGEGEWTLDLRGDGSVQKGIDPAAECTVTFSPDAFATVAQDPARAWRLAGGPGLRATNRLRGAQLLEALFPGTLARCMPPRLLTALYPGLGAAEPKCTSIGDFFERVLPMKLRANPKLLRTVRAAYEFEIADAGTWTLDLNGEPRVHAGPTQFAKCSVKASREAFEAVLADEARVWDYFNAGEITVSNACRASRFVQAVWPRAFPKAMPPSLYRSLFPEMFQEPSAPEYNAVTGDYITYVQGKKGAAPIKYSRLGDLAIYEGDIILGTVDEMESVRAHFDAGGQGPMPQGFRIIDWGDPTKYLWPDGKVYYTAPGGAEPDKDVRDAMDHWKRRPRSPSTSATTSRTTSRSRRVTAAPRTSE